MLIFGCFLFSIVNVAVINLPGLQYTAVSSSTCNHVCEIIDTIAFMAQYRFFGVYFIKNCMMSPHDIGKIFEKLNKIFMLFVV